MNPWLKPIIFLTGGLIAGFIFEKILVSKFKKLAKKTPWEIDDVILHSLEGFAQLWFVLAGLYGTVLSSPITTRHSAILQKVLLVIVLFSVTVALSRIAARLITHYGRREGGVLPSATILVNLARAFTFGIGFLTILHSLGISIAPALAALGVGALAVALALQDPLTNLFSGLQIVGSGQIATGQYIRLSTGEEGYVKDVTWRNTTILTLTNNVILIPNSKLATNIITNFHEPDPETAVLIDLSVSYKSDLDQVEKIAVEVGREVMNTVEGSVTQFEPVVRYQRLADFSITLTIVLRCKEYSFQGAIRSAFIKKIHQRFKEEGFDIPYPPVGTGPTPQ